MEYCRYMGKVKMRKNKVKNTRSKLGKRAKTWMEDMWTSEGVGSDTPKR